jgi:hypothetical protein
MDRPSSRLSSHHASAPPPEQHDFRSDQDPSEWKPSITNHRGRRLAPPGSAALQFLSQFHRTPGSVCFSSQRPVSADRALSRSSSSSGLSSWHIAPTAPSLYHSSAGTSPTDSVLDTPKGEGLELAVTRTKAMGSEASLRSLAPVVESEDDIREDVVEAGEGLEMGNFNKLAPSQVQAETSAEGSLRKLLEEKI